MSRSARVGTPWLLLRLRPDHSQWGACHLMHLSPPAGAPATPSPASAAQGVADLFFRTTACLRADQSACFPEGVYRLRAPRHASATAAVACPSCCTSPARQPCARRCRRAPAADATSPYERARGRGRPRRHSPPSRMAPAHLPHLDPTSCHRQNILPPPPGVITQATSTTSTRTLVWTRWCKSTWRLRTSWRAPRA